jgi:hypothetical protein
MQYMYIVVKYKSNFVRATETGKQVNISTSVELFVYITENSDLFSRLS